MSSVAAVSASVRPANKHSGFGRCRTKGGSHGVCTILRVRWRTDEHRRDGPGLQPGAEIAPRERQDGSKMGAASGSVRRIASPVLPMPASFRATKAKAERSSAAAEGAVAFRMPCALRIGPPTSSMCSAANVEALLDPDAEDKTMPALLSAGLAAWIAVV